MNKYMFIVAFGSLVAGCNSTPENPITFSIETLGSEAAQRGDGEFEYRSSVSITGISPPYSVGGLITVPGRELPDVLGVPITSSCSQIIETKYESDATRDDILHLAKAIEGVREQLTLRAINQTKSQGLKTLLESPENIETMSDNQKLLLKSQFDLSDITEGNVVSLQNSLETSIEKQSQEIAEATKEIIDLRQKKNIYIFRWNRASQSSTGGTAGDIASANKSSSSATSGYLIAADLRTSSMAYGDDFVLRQQSGTKDSGSDSIVDNTFVVNYTLGAKAHYFSEDQNISEAIRASLKLSIDDLKSLYGGQIISLIKAQSIAVETALQSSAAMGARGMSVAPVTTVYPYRFWGDSARSAARQAEMERNNNYTVFYSTRSNIGSIRLANELTSPHKFYCMQSVPKQGSISSVIPDRRGFEFCSPKGWETEAGRKVLGKLSAHVWKPDLKNCIDFNQPINGTSQTIDDKS